MASSPITDAGIVRHSDARENFIPQGDANQIPTIHEGKHQLTKNRGPFPSDEALLKLFYLAMNNISKKWTMPVRDWKAALNRLTIQFEDRMP